MKQELRHKDTGNFFRRYCKSFLHALNGLWYVICCEHNMIIILTAIFVVTLAGFYFEISKVEWIFCIISFGIVTTTELMNSAIEAVCDLITTKIHPLVKVAKDTMSAATLVCCFTAFIIGLIIFIPKIVNLII